MFLAGVVWLWGAAVFYFALAFAALACETCDDFTWRGNPDAWQWDVLATLGGVVFVATTAFLVFLRRGRAGRAAFAFSVALAAALSAAFLRSPDWPARASSELVLFLAVGVGAAVTAIMLIAPREAVPRAGQRSD